jgi:hypothetical protein
MDKNKRKEELLQQLIKKIEEKNKAFRGFVVGILLVLCCFLLDGLYNAVRFLVWRGDFGEKRVEGFQKLLGKIFPFLFLLWFAFLLISVVISIRRLAQ